MAEVDDTSVKDFLLDLSSRPRRLDMTVGLLSEPEVEGRLLSPPESTTGREKEDVKGGGVNWLLLLLGDQTSPELQPHSMLVALKRKEKGMAERENETKVLSITKRDENQRKAVIILTSQSYWKL